MPQLLSRMDQSGWLTPSIADILEQGAAPPGGEETIRAQAIELQKTLAENGTPARIINVRPTSSRTLYIARADNRGSKKGNTANDMLRSLLRLGDRAPDWTLGFLPKIQEANAFGILLRTENHQQVRLRQLMIRAAYREHPSTLALVLGITLEQQTVIRDLTKSGHLLVMGAELERRQFIWTLLLTLTLLNTPSELRIALAGICTQEYTHLLDTPHVLGRPLLMPRDGQRLLDGLVKEIQRRQQWFREKKVSNLAAYNAELRKTNIPPLPRIVFLIDALSDLSWQTASEEWTPSIYDLLMNGAATGIHLVLATGEASAVSSLLSGAIPLQIYLKSHENAFKSKIPADFSAASAFVDALVVEQEKETLVTPIETAIMTDEEIQRGTAYWRHANAQHVQEAPIMPFPVSTGVTGLLTSLPESLTTKPGPEAVAKAAQALSKEETSAVIRQAQALAAYLGWLAPGPLQDIFELSTNEAQAIIATLQTKGVLEGGSGSMLRFIRLADNPLKR